MTEIELAERAVLDAAQEVDVLEARQSELKVAQRKARAMVADAWRNWLNYERDSQ